MVEMLIQLVELLFIAVVLWGVATVLGLAIVRVIEKTWRHYHG